MKEKLRVRKQNRGGPSSQDSIQLQEQAQGHKSPSKKKGSTSSNRKPITPMPANVLSHTAEALSQMAVSTEMGQVTKEDVSSSNDQDIEAKTKVARNRSKEKQVLSTEDKPHSISAASALDLDLLAHAITEHVKERDKPDETAEIGPETKVYDTKTMEQEPNSLKKKLHEEKEKESEAVGSTMPTPEIKTESGKEERKGRRRSNRMQSVPAKDADQPDVKQEKEQTVPTLRRSRRFSPSY